MENLKFREFILLVTDLMDWPKFAVKMGKYELYFRCFIKIKKNICILHLSAVAAPYSLLFSILIGAYYNEKHLKTSSGILFEF